MYLNAHTYYSLHYGVVDPKTFLQLGIDSGFETMVLTDINNTSACLEFIKEASKTHIKPVVGVDFRDGVQQKFIALAMNNNGYETINCFLTELLHEEPEVPDKAPKMDDVFIIYPYQRGMDVDDLRGNEYIGVRPTDIDYVRLKGIPTHRMVPLHTATFRSKRDYNAHRLLRAIDNNILLSKLPRSEQADEKDRFVSLETLNEWHKELPDLLKNRDQILNNCSIFFDFSEVAEPQNQRVYISEEEDLELLYKLCEEGVHYRYPHMSEEISQRIEKELTTIEEMGFVSYFLMNWDIVQYARSKGYFYVGRGSGANSVVAYLLNITDVDPIELDLYFERFINLYRKNPPDFDIDFSWKNREDMTRYIFERFDNVALVATYNTFQYRAVVRELGKVFGLPKEEIDKLSKGTILPWEINELSQLVLKYAQYIQGFPSHLSVHASGIIISELPTQHFSATFLPPKGYPTIQFDMHIAEDVGLYKFDILSQRGLSKIKDALDIIEYNQPDRMPIDIHDIKGFKEDENIKEMLRSANAIGCFYVESPAMRMLLRKLQVEDYLGLVAASSVIRPGVAKSGMMHEYIRRFRHPEARKEAHPILLDLMPETFGVMVYQEDVIKVAHHFAALTLGEADKMRRGMSGKFRSREEFHAVKKKFFDNCQTIKGYSYELTAEVWRQTESFAGYAFAKGHSASYAVESYQCLFLKAYFPLEFMVATINNYGGFYSTELYMLEARAFGAQIEAPCVNRSYLATVIDGHTIFLGFHLLHSFDQKLAKRIEAERWENGQFTGLDNFIERVPIGIEGLTILIRINAFRFTGKNKRELMWEAHFKLEKHNTGGFKKDLFRVQPKQYQLPSLTSSVKEDTFDQIELLGFPLYSPFSILRDASEESILASELIHYVGKKVWIEGYLIHAKRTSTSKGERMYFGTFLDRKEHWLDTVHFPDVAARYRFRGKGVYRVFGTVTSEYDCVLIEVEYMEKKEVIEDPRYVEQKVEKEGLITSNNRVDHFRDKRK